MWDKLNDPEVLKECMPGCEELERIGDNEFQAVANTKVGPVKARFKGKMNLPISIRRTATASRAKARAASPALPRAAQRCRWPTRTAARSTYDVEAQIGGKLAQLGQRLINGAAKKIADEFFAEFTSCGRRS